MTKQTIYWDTINHFTPQEFSEDPDKFAHDELIKRLDFWREAYGYAVEPSKAPGALARTGMEHRTSYHFADPDAGIYARAVDVFPKGPIKRAFLSAMLMGFSGIGVYFWKNNNDGNQAVMFHLDIRPGPRKIWYWTIDTGYNYFMEYKHDSTKISSFWNMMGVS